jgi:hypothetical protein
MLDPSRTEVVQLPSAGVAFGHESHFHGPLFSTLAAVGPQGKRSRRWTLEAVLYTSLLMVVEPSRALKDRLDHRQARACCCHPHCATPAPCLWELKRKSAHEIRDFPARWLMHYSGAPS